MRWRAMLLSLLLPGMGHTAIGRGGRGMAVTALFTLSVVAAVYRGATVKHASLDPTYMALVVLVALVYLFSQLAMLRVLIRAAVSAARPAKEDHLRAGMVAATRGDDTLAERELRRVLAIDPTDIEAHLNLGALYGRSGELRRARRHLRHCSHFDLEGKWTWEVERELSALKHGTNGTPE